MKKIVVLLIAFISITNANQIHGWQIADTTIDSTKVSKLSCDNLPTECSFYKDNLWKINNNDVLVPYLEDRSVAIEGNVVDSGNANFSISENLIIKSDVKYNIFFMRGNIKSSSYSLFGGKYNEIKLGNTNFLLGDNDTITGSNCNFLSGSGNKIEYVNHAFIIGDSIEEDTITNTFLCNYPTASFNGIVYLDTIRSLSDSSLLVPCSGGTGNFDSFYVKRTADSTSEGWITNEDTLFIDTSYTVSWDTLGAYWDTTNLFNYFTNDSINWDTLNSYNDTSYHDSIYVVCTAGTTTCGYISRLDTLFIDTTSGSSGGTSPWTKSGNYIYPSNIGDTVGIGTSNLSGQIYKFIVSGGEGSVNVLIEADTDNINEADQPCLVLSQDNGAVKGKIGFFETENIFSIYNTYSDLLSFGTNNNRKMLVIDTSGYIGIGTTDPSHKLTLYNGDMLVDNGDMLVDNGNIELKKNSDNVGIFFYEGADTIYSIFYDGNLSSPNNYLKIRSEYNTYEKNIIIIDQDGNCSIGDETPFVPLSVNGALVAGGTYGEGWEPSAHDYGTMLMWYPRMRAFRCGYTDSTRFANYNIGYSSIAMGYNSVATNNYSVSIGLSCFSTGFASISLGEQNMADGEASIACGDSTHATGKYSASFGYKTVSSYLDFVIGRFNVGGGSDTNWVDSDPIFEIGIGSSSDSTKNAVTVLKDGRVKIEEILIIVKSHTPDSTGDSYGYTGQITWDDNYLYIKTNNGWKRATLSTW